MKVIVQRLIELYQYNGSLLAFGNLLVLFVILRNIRMRSRTNFFLANLALADLCVGLFCVFPNMSTFLSPTWILGRAMCKVYYFVHQMSYTASITLLTVISMERYLAIMHPLKAQRLITKRKLRAALVVIWLLSAAYNVPQLIMFDTVYFPDGDVTFCYTTVQVVDMRVYHTANFVIWISFKKNCNECTYLKENELNNKVKETPSARSNGRLRCLELRGVGKKFNVPKERCHEYDVHQVSEDIESETKFDHLEDSLSAASETDRSDRSSTPSPRMRVSLIVNRKNKCGRNWPGQSVDESAYVTQVVRPELKRKGSGRRRDKTKYSALHARRKVIRLLVAVVVSFAVCVLPYHVLILMKDWATSSTATSIFSLFPPVSYLILYLNSGLNPMLYALFSDNFRRSLAEAFKCRNRDG
ncbi:trissin receptor-like [Liolophura sinensis]|uniref:trissin receptor-like n=1 Tax=Liolophura sinensis TaxID=3198878 RepID=UPI003158CCA4